MNVCCLEPGMSAPVPGMSTPVPGTSTPATDKRHRFKSCNSPSSTRFSVEDFEETDLEAEDEDHCHGHLKGISVSVAEGDGELGGDEPDGLEGPHHRARVGQDVDRHDQCVRWVRASL